MGLIFCESGPVDLYNAPHSQHPVSTGLPHHLDGDVLGAARDR
jgi:hypothetical protein